MVAEPLIVTALLDETSARTLDDLRSRYFPPDRNIVPAHISLFHHLPGEELRTVLAAIRKECAPLHAFELRALPPRFLGHGVALAYEHDHLSALHAAMSRAFAGWLTAQDRQPFKAHVTIQNKVTKEKARALYETVSTQLAPPCRVTGVSVWHYCGGPWRLAAECPFGDWTAG